MSDCFDFVRYCDFDFVGIDKDSGERKRELHSQRHRDRERKREGHRHTTRQTDTKKNPKKTQRPDAKWLTLSSAAAFKARFSMWYTVCVCVCVFV